MNKPNFFIFAFIFAAMLFFNVARVSAQNGTTPTAAPGFEVTLHVLVGSNGSDGEGKLPDSLSGAVKKIKDNFAFNNLRLLSTYYELCGANNGIEHKGILNQSAPVAESLAPRFSEWKLYNLTAINNSDGQPQIQFKYFYYGIRIPILLQSPKIGDTDKNNPSIVYESTGISLNSVSVSENTPTVIGSMETGKSDEILFFILTVKSKNG